MRFTTKSVIVAGVSMGLLVLLIIPWGCSCPSNDSTGDTVPSLALRSYGIAPELAQEFSTILNNVLDRGEKAIPAGRAHIGPGGQLIVAAPVEVLDEIEEMITNIENSTPGAPPMITISYWIVVGTPDDKTTWSSRIQELAPALNNIAMAEGPTRFTLSEKIQIQALSGEKGYTEGQKWRIRQKATARKEHVFADLYLSRTRGGGTLETRVNLTTDQLLVLGQAGFDPYKSSDSETAIGVYFVVKASIEPASNR